MFGRRDKTEMVSATEALPGRTKAMLVPERHLVLGTPLLPPFPNGIESALFALGCFWGAERLFWTQTGVYSTSVGYAGGFTANPTYEEVCSGRTGHAETVLVAFDPAIISYGTLLRLFWEAHDPTAGMRQGNDVGTQYRSMVLTASPEQERLAQASQATYQAALRQAGRGVISTEIVVAGPFFWAEPEHQQYLARNPNGYCGLRGTGVRLC
ncbi:peptide-methionine (S)-S-oxide reductase MsrA [Magnetospirillum fulvum]|uniref:Peptide methionine sulfoxide reductase MsrA n=1 Tax=Magnetospirillum fulvum TaxID=1082 RepID=A0A1H6H4V1_MAGFU|nr:peptide-methionine (S)-S-oxide reductase MsrA [Magnetospirillum fulvum]SEH30749.1 peptide-methionine (S)-S-oxide reductase [Magnetospirillum fulvum]